MSRGARRENRQAFLRDLCGSSFASFAVKGFVTPVTKVCAAAPQSDRIKTVFDKTL